MKAKNKLSLFGNKFVNIREGDLYLGSKKVLDLTKKYQFPTFIYVLDKVKANIQLIQESFLSIFPDSQGFYSLKSNFLQPIIETAMKEGFGAEIIGRPELRLIQKINFPENKVLAGGPFLPDYFIEDLAKTEINYIVVYDLDDLKKIHDILKEKKGQKQKILIRFQAPKYTGVHGVEFTEENIKLIENLFQQYDNLEFMGILSHLGIRLKTFEHYEKNIDFMIKIAQEFHSSTSLKVTIFNIGGGFPHADSIKKTQLIEILTKIKQKFLSQDMDIPLIFYEPGRFVVSDTGFCLCKVRKVDKKRSIAFLDIGNNHIPKFMKSSLRFYNVSKIGENPNTPINFYGNIPSDQDILSMKYNFTPSVEKGDFILIANIGAYAQTWSTRFPYPLPAIMTIEGENENLIFHPDKNHDFSLS